MLSSVKLIRGGQDAIISETCPRRPGCYHQQGKTAPSRAAYSRHGAEPAANGGPSKPE